VEFLLISSSPASCLPWIPEQGTVGASGDLAPLAHLALGLMGESKMWSRKSGWADAKLVSCSMSAFSNYMLCTGTFCVHCYVSIFHCRCWMRMD
jgi:hypothetical protein